MLLRTLATQAACLFILVIGLSAEANIFVSDNRVDMWPVPAQLQPVGMLRALPDDSNWGTAFLVGQCHILTAFHVAFPESRNSKFVPSSKVQSMFYVGRTEGNRESPTGFRVHAKATPVKWGNYMQFRPDGKRRTVAGVQNDWAILKLDDCLGRSFGVVDFTVPIKATDEREYRVQVAGFPLDRTKSSGMTLEKKCTIRDFGPDLLSGVDCAIVMGASGGPVFEERDNVLYPIGIVVRESHAVAGILPQYTEYNRNLILLAEQFLPDLRKVLDAQ